MCYGGNKTLSFLKIHIWSPEWGEKLQTTLELIENNRIWNIGLLHLKPIGSGKGSWKNLPSPLHPSPKKKNTKIRHFLQFFFFLNIFARHKCIPPHAPQINK